jgi:hypothetical protein
MNGLSHPIITIFEKQYRQIQKLNNFLLPITYKVNKYKYIQLYNKM